MCHMWTLSTLRSAGSSQQNHLGTCGWLLRSSVTFASYSESTEPAEHHVASSGAKEHDSAKPPHLQVNSVALADYPGAPPHGGAEFEEDADPEASMA